VIDPSRRAACALDASDGDVAVLDVLEAHADAAIATIPAIIRFMLRSCRLVR
jgi:hypothetical protein